MNKLKFFSKFKPLRPGNHGGTLISPWSLSPFNQNSFSIHCLNGVIFHSSNNPIKIGCFCMSNGKTEVQGLNINARVTVQIEGWLQRQRRLFKAVFLLMHSFLFLSALPPVITPCWTFTERATAFETSVFASPHVGMDALWDTLSSVFL